MKKVLVSLLVLALCAPAMAATVSFLDNADGTGTFTISTVGVGDEYIVGVGLDVSATAAITAVDIPDTFQIYPDYAQDQEVNGDGYLYGEGSGDESNSAALILEAGPTTLGTSFCLSFAMLNGEATPGADGAQTIAITLSAADGTEVTISENAIRGGLVGTNGEDIALTGDLTGTITAGVPTCADLFAANALYQEYVDNGADPTCWCNQYQCRGDINDAVDYAALHWRVYTADLGILALATNWRKGPATGADPCADINHAYDYPALSWAIYTADLGILAGNWRKSGVGEGSAFGEFDVCPEYIAP